MIQWLKKRLFNDDVSTSEDSDEELIKRIKDVQKNLPTARQNLESSITLLVAATTIDKSEEKSEGEVRKKVKNLIGDIEKIESNLEELLEILAINDKIKKHLLSPIDASQNKGIWVSIIFGFVGLLLTGPQVFQYFSTKSDPYTKPEYYTSVRLQNIRQYFDDGLLNDVNDASQDIIKDSKEEKSVAQAKVYLALNNILKKNVKKDGLLKSIEQIPDNIDSFITGQKLLITAIYHSNNSDYEEATNVLRKMANDEIYENFHLEANYYRFLTEIESLDLNKIDSKRISDLKAYVSHIEKSENENKFLDKTTGKLLDKFSAVQKAKEELNDIEKLYEGELKEKTIRENINSLKVAIRYNRYIYKSKVHTNKKVKQRAKQTVEIIRKAYPQISIDIKSISPNEIRAGGYGSDMFYAHNKVAKTFFDRELIKSQKLANLKRHISNGALTSEYGKYDLVLLYAEE